MAGSLAHALFLERGKRVRVVCPLETESALLADGALQVGDEDELIPLLAQAKTIVADPLYRPICPSKATFVPLAHEAFSGRIYRRDIPNLIGRELNI